MPLFITFEGPDGSGKSTQARLLADHLRSLRGNPRVAVVEVREPGGTELGEAIRHLILDPNAPTATPLAMALLYEAARAQLVETVVRPALQSDATVVLDRYADSTVAYQGYGLGVDRDEIRELNRIATGGLRPDVSVYVDIEPEVGLQRVRERGARDRLDRETLEFHHRVRSGYLDLIAEDPERWICVDGNAPREDVLDAILRQLRPLLETMRSSA